MVLFALLFTLFLILLIGVGLSAGLTLGTAAAVLLYRFRPSKRGLHGGFLGGLALLVLAIAILAATWRYAAWLLPPLIAEQRRFAAERAEKPTLDPAMDEARGFVKAQAAYHAANGFFDTPECLARPETCIPGYSGPPFLVDAKVAGTRGAFHWSFHPGPAPPGLSTMKDVSPSSISTYALLGVPTGGTEGASSVCGDFSGVCTFYGRTLDGTGGCPADCLRHSWLGDDTVPPLVVGFSPPKGPPGTTITVTGAKLSSGFSTDWRFGGVPQPHYSSGEDETTIVVPKGAVSGKITVTTSNGTASSATDFIVLSYTGLAVGPVRVKLVEGESGQLAATASLSDGTTADVTGEASWTSARPEVATVDAKGLVVSQAPGTTKITASLEGTTAVSIVEVAAPARKPAER